MWLSPWLFNLGAIDIAMFRWGQAPTLRVCADLGVQGRIEIRPYRGDCTPRVFPPFGRGTTPVCGLVRNDIMFRLT